MTIEQALTYGKNYVLVCRHIGNPKSNMEEFVETAVKALEVVKRQNEDKVIHSHWDDVSDEYIGNYMNFRCANCGAMSDDNTPYCQLCGAKMDELGDKNDY